MIHVDIPASMECVDKGCDARLAIKLALMVGGTLVGRPPHGHGWQIAVMENGVLMCRCPAHHMLVEQVTPRLVGAKH
jgi:hypothetical protein